MPISGQFPVLEILFCWHFRYWSLPICAEAQNGDGRWLCFRIVRLSRFIVAYRMGSLSWFQSVL